MAVKKIQYEKPVFAARYAINAALSKNLNTQQEKRSRQVGVHAIAAAPQHALTTAPPPSSLERRAANQHTNPEVPDRTTDRMRRAVAEPHKSAETSHIHYLGVLEFDGLRQFRRFAAGPDGASYQPVALDDARNELQPRISISVIITI